MTLIDGPTPDPDDPLMEHHFYYGHIPGVLDAQLPERT